MIFGLSKTAVNIAKLILLHFLIFTCLLSPPVFAKKSKIVNIYGWTGEVPDFVIRQFEKETGIKINFSTYENNEIMYSKLRAARYSGYDIVMPSSYMIDHMRQQNMLIPLDKNKIPNWKNLNPTFLQATNHSKTYFCVPFVWGITGIFINSRYHNPVKIKKWDDLWDKRFENQLMLLDDMREIFSMALLSLGYSANDRDPKHLEQAFIKLKKLMPNVKVFSSDMIVSIIVDEDATIGMAWNGDTYKAAQENPSIQFVYPAEGFIIWVDNLAIPRNAPHEDAAYTFINFMLRPEIAKRIALYTHFPTANLAAQNLLPDNIGKNPSIYPPESILKRGEFQSDVGVDDKILGLYEKYWEQLKMQG